MTMFPDHLTCEICYEAGSDVKPGMAWYRVPSKEPVQKIDRCRDVEACRARVEARGERWPLRQSGEAVEA